MQERPLHQPNDHLFKSVFSSPMNAAGLLKNHLPPQLSELINADVQVFPLQRLSTIEHPQAQSVGPEKLTV